MGAAAAGMVGASWGSYDRTPGRGPGCGGLRTAPGGPERRHLRPPTPDLARKHHLGTKYTGDRVQLRCFLIPARDLQANPAPGTSEAGLQEIP